MKKRKWLGCFVVLLFFIAFIVIFYIIFREMAKPALPNTFYLKLTLSGPLTDYVQPGPFDILTQKKKGIGFVKIIQAIERAKTDKRVKGIVLYINQPSAGLAKIQEFHRVIQDFRASKKPVYAFMEVEMDGGYFMGLASDTIILAEDGLLIFNGTTHTIILPKGFFKKIGIDFQGVRFGDYKTASDFFLEDHVRDAYRQMSNWLLSSFHKQTQQLLKTRKNLKLSWSAMTQHGIFSSDTALANGLVDKLMDLNDFHEFVKKKLGKKSVSLQDYIEEKPHESGELTCALIYAQGSIVDGKGEPGQSIGSWTYTEYLRSVKKKKNVPCVLIRVDSPGGSAIASDHIFEAINDLKASGKKVVVSMSDVAGSGGYYIAMNADAIIAEKGTLTGSIGAFAVKPVIKPLMDKLDIYTEIYSLEPSAGIWSIFEYMNEHQYKIFSAELKHIYDRFLKKASTSRKIPLKEMDELAEGRVWTGEQALERKLVDALGGFRTARKVLLQLLKKPETTKIRWLVYPRPKTALEAFLDLLKPSSRTSYTQNLLEQIPITSIHFKWWLESLFQSFHQPFLTTMPFVLQNTELQRAR